MLLASQGSNYLKKKKKIRKIKREEKEPRKTIKKEEKTLKKMSLFKKSLWKDNLLAALKTLWIK